MSILLQIILYVILEIVPCALLAVAPFPTQLRSKRALWTAILLLCCVGVIRRYIVLQNPSMSAILSILWIVLYVIAWRYVLTAPLAKFLFILVLVLNFASLVTILYNYVGIHLLGAPLETAPYGLQTSLSILLVLLPTFPILYYWLTHEVAPLIESEQNNAMWSYLWLVPVIFCVFYYYSLYASDSILAFARDTYNLIFSVFISAGSFFVMFLVLRLVQESNLTLLLQSQNHQLSLHTLQYQRLQERIDEARRARHDLRQITTVMQAFLQSGDTAALRLYVQQYCAALPDDLPFVCCNHTALDALLGYYQEQATQLGILFELQAASLQGIPVQDTDLVVLFGNLLENAIESCIRQESGERFIRLTIRRQGNSVVVSLRNSCDRPLIHDADGIRSSKRPSTGIGLTSIEQITQKYHGTTRFTCDGREFRTALLLQPMS